jgi:hypothetical protein
VSPSETNGPTGQARGGSAADHRWLEGKVGATERGLSRGQYRRQLVMCRALHAMADDLRDAFAAERASYGFDRDDSSFGKALDSDLAALGAGAPPIDVRRLSVAHEPCFPTAGQSVIASG